MSLPSTPRAMWLQYRRQTAVLLSGLVSGRGLLALVLLAIVLPFAGFFVLDLLFPFPVAALHRPPALTVADREGVPLRFFLPADGRFRLPVGLGELPPELPRALVASEDQRFFR